MSEDDKELTRSLSSVGKIPKSNYETVNHPPHYNAGKFEVIDVLDDWKCGFSDGNAIKYIARYRHKNGVEDLKKAVWYLQHLIEQLENKETACKVNQTMASTVK